MGVSATGIDSQFLANMPNGGPIINLNIGVTKNVPQHIIKGEVQGLGHVGINGIDTNFIVSYLSHFVKEIEG
jgi:hypothetical protein